MSKGQIENWYIRSQIDYVEQYTALYTSFNVWYRCITGKTNDRQALNYLRRGNDIWRAYCKGVCLYELRAYMDMLVECTQRTPLSYASPHWQGEVDHNQDWPSLLEYWYRVRCLVVHGAKIDTQYVYLAYATLTIFMGEIIKRQKLH